MFVVTKKVSKIVLNDIDMLICIFSRYNINNDHH